MTAENEGTAFKKIVGIVQPLTEVQGTPWKANGQLELIDDPALEAWSEVRNLFNQRVEGRKDERYIHSTKIHYDGRLDSLDRPHLESKFLSKSTIYWIAYCEEGHLYLYSSPPDGNDFSICRFNTTRDTESVPQ